MSRKPIRVLVIDDSPLVRELIVDSLLAQYGFEIAGVAADGFQGLQLLEELRPDVVTLDLQMPGKDGLTTLEEILQRRPTPVIVVSALTQRAAESAVDALQRGAMDYVAKPEGMAAMRKSFGEELPAKIRNMVGVDVAHVLQLRRARAERRQLPVARLDDGSQRRCAASCVAIGVSTGGPPALARLFAALAPPLPPIVVVQHMPEMFTRSFAERLNSLSPLTVKEAEEGDVLQPNCAYVAPGGKQLRIRRRGESGIIEIFDGEFVSGHKPSVDVMMSSVAAVYGDRCVGVIMTGMGRDGADGCGAIRAAGGFVLGQDEESSDVYGMNKVAWVEGNVDLQTSLDHMPEAIVVRVGQLPGPRKPVMPFVADAIR
ncbi:MAG: chemotaxis response regulator protein-glutamate methylesterase [Planctomycetaceae bacterium]|nr:chemotaxis response regulator protein-glutamate methylesterase [Planctomycetaceae bacterium]